MTTVWGILVGSFIDGGTFYAELLRAVCLSPFETSYGATRKFMHSGRNAGRPL